VATASSPAGQYAITVAGGSDDFYELQGYLPGTLTIAAARQSIAFDPIAPKAYGDVFTLSAKADSGLPVSFAIENGPAAVSGPDGATLTVTNLGTILVKATQAGDANFLAALPVSQSFSVGQSVLGVAAANVTKVYGGPDPALPILYTGFKLGETNAILATQPVAATAATVSSPVGTYPITVSGGSDGHYILQGYQPGTLTITPAPQTIVFGPIPDKAYGDVFQADAVSGSGLPVTFSVASGPAQASGARGATITITNQGIVTIKASQPGDGNFGSAADAFRSFTVVRSVLTAKANDITRRSRQPNPVFGIVYSGLKLGETSAVLDVLPSASSAATAASAPGTYPIIVSGGATDN